MDCRNEKGSGAMKKLFLPFVAVAALAVVDAQNRRESDDLPAALPADVVRRADDRAHDDERRMERRPLTFAEDPDAIPGEVERPHERHRWRPGSSQDQARLPERQVHDDRPIGDLARRSLRPGAAVSRFGQWVTLKKVRLGGKSSAVFRLRLPKGKSRIRVAMSINQAGAGYLDGYSGTITVRRR